ncbi:MAG: hypothetical protein WAK78_16040, partial [Candidatus Acidiferrales bacterium]
TPRMVELGTARKDHMIYAGRGQLGGATSLGPSIQERRGGFQLPEPEQRTPPPQPEPQPQPPPQPQPQTEVPQPAEQPPANIPPQPNNPEPPQ